VFSWTLGCEPRNLFWRNGEFASRVFAHDRVSRLQGK